MISRAHSKPNDSVILFGLEFTDHSKYHRLPTCRMCLDLGHEVPLPEPSVLLLGQILLCFSSAGTVLHVQNIYSYRGNCARYLQGLGGDLKSCILPMSCIHCSAFCFSATVTGDSF